MSEELHYHFDKKQMQKHFAKNDEVDTTKIKVEYDPSVIRQSKNIDKELLGPRFVEPLRNHNNGKIGKDERLHMLQTKVDEGKITTFHQAVKMLNVSPSTMRKYLRELKITLK